MCNIAPYDTSRSSSMVHMIYLAQIIDNLDLLNVRNQPIESLSKPLHHNVNSSFTPIHILHTTMPQLGRQTRKLGLSDNYAFVNDVVC